MPAAIEWRPVTLPKRFAGSAETLAAIQGPTTRNDFVGNSYAGVTLSLIYKLTFRGRGQVPAEIEWRPVTLVMVVSQCHSFRGSHSGQRASARCDSGDLSHYQSALHEVQKHSLPFKALPHGTTLSAKKALCRKCRDSHCLLIR